MLELPVHLLELLCAKRDALFQILIEFAQFFEQLFVAAFQKQRAGGGLERLKQMVGVERLEQESVNLAAIDCIESVFQRGPRGHQNANGGGLSLSNPLSELYAGFTGDAFP